MNASFGILPAIRPRTLCPIPTLASYRPSMRPLIENTIEGLIAFLDDVDGDSDIEPSIGGDDREDEDDHGTDEHGGQEYGPGHRRAA
ncbi:hypothetical protein RUR49_06780 [Pseudoxanthobacter sp. M-2]|uniref:hypothetical protein n=1 Tax=Pseudoxanthobacter sp. M-2 TaxID=3078754 RepID=UPI0038FC36D1